MTLSRRLVKHALFIASAVSVAISANARADELVVSAAASLTNAFKAVSEVFEQQHPGTKVLLNFGASDVLMQQIVKGAPADVFASADQKAMDKAAAEKVIVPATRSDFAANSLVLIVPAGILAGGLLAFARALGEFGATLMIAGNLPGRTQTLSVAVYSAVQAGDDSTANFLVLVTSVTCVVILLLAGRLVPQHTLVESR